jgi:hypothetical protein
MHLLPNSFSRETIIPAYRELPIKWDWIAYILKSRKNQKWQTLQIRFILSKKISILLGIKNVSDIKVVSSNMV